jgi:hypothetical protein
MKHDTKRRLVEQIPAKLLKHISERSKVFIETESGSILKTKKFQNFRRLLSPVCTAESYSTAS